MQSSLPNQPAAKVLESNNKKKDADPKAITISEE